MPFPAAHAHVHGYISSRYKQTRLCWSSGSALELTQPLLVNNGQLVETALQSIKAKKFSRFLKDTVLALARPVKALRRIREYVEADPTTEIAQQAEKDNTLFQSFEETILTKVSSLVQAVVGRWEGHQVIVLVWSQHTFL